MSKNSSKAAFGALIAGAIGFAAGLLTAPKSGKETRRDLQRAALKAKTDSERKLKQLHSELDDLMQDVQAKAGSAQGRAKDEMKQALNSAAEAKEKAKNILSAIHEGDAEDKDLKKAIGEAKSSIDHLKQYIKAPRKNDQA